MATVMRNWWDGLDDAQFIAECRRRGVMYSCDALGYYVASEQEVELALARRGIYGPSAPEKRVAPCKSLLSRGRQFIVRGCDNAKLWLRQEKSTR